MLLAVTILCGVFLGWVAGREGVLAVVPPTVAAAGVPTLAGSLRFLFNNWRLTLRRFSTHGSRVLQREAVTTLGWVSLFRLLVVRKYLV